VTALTRARGGGLYNSNNQSFLPDGGKGDAAVARPIDGGSLGPSDARSDGDASRDGALPDGAPIDATLPPPDGSPPTAVISADAILFGLVDCGGSAPPDQILTIQNGGGSPLDWSAALEGGDTFSLSSPVSGTLAPGATAQVRVTATAVPASSAAGAETLSVLRLTTTDAAKKKVAIPVSMVANGGTLTLNPSSASFGQYPLRKAAPDLPLTLKNEGNGPLTFTIGTPSDPQFTLAGVTPGTDVTLAAGQTVTGLTAKFTPTTTKTTSASAPFTPKGAVCGTSVSAIAFDGQGTAGVVGISPGKLDFGKVRCGGQAAAQVVTVRNTGNGSVTFTAALDVATAPYALAVSPSNGVLAAGAAGTITVTPQAVPADTTPLDHQFAANLKVTTTGAQADGDQLIPLDETALGARLVFDPVSLPFGEVPISTKATSPFSLKNVGNAPATVTFAVDGTDFSFEQPSKNSTAGTSLAGTAIFAPTAASARSGTLSFTTGASDVVCPSTPASKIALTGTGTNGQLSLDTQDLTFGNVDCGKQGQARTVTLTNVGSASFQWTLAADKGTASPYKVDVTSGTLASGSRAVLTVTPKPIPSVSSTNTDAFADRLVVTTTVPGDTPHAINLHETANGAILTFVPTTLAFGNVPLAATHPALSLRIANGGNARASVRLASSDTHFTLGATTVNGISGGGGQSDPVGVTFAPDAAQGFSGSISLDPATTVLCAPAPAAVALTGTGTNGVVTVSPNSVDFGAIDCGTQTQQKVQISNEGSAAFNITAAQITGTNPGYAVTLAVPATVNPGDTATLTLTSPTASAPIQSYNATLRLTTTVVGNDAQINVPITATSRGAILTFKPVSLDFGTVSPGSSSQVAFSITNDGNAAVGVTLTPDSTTSPFSLPMQTSVGASATTPLTGTFTPTDVGTFSGTAKLTFDAAVCSSNLTAKALPFTGVGARASVPGSVDFGLVNCGAQAASKPLTVSNRSGAAFNAHVESTTGNPLKYFSLTPGLNTSFAVAAGGSASVTVQPVAIPSGAAGPVDLSAGAFTETVLVKSDITGDTGTQVTLVQAAQGVILQIDPASFVFKANSGADQTNAFTVVNAGNLASSQTYAFTPAAPPADAFSLGKLGSIPALAPNASFVADDVTYFGANYPSPTSAKFTLTVPSGGQADPICAPFPVLELDSQ
jgi:hypothetical protein